MSKSPLDVKVKVGRDRGTQIKATKPAAKTDWAVEAGVTLVIFVVCSMAVVLFWLALQYICGVGEPWPVIVLVVAAVVTLRFIAFGIAAVQSVDDEHRPLREGRGIKPETEKPRVESQRRIDAAISARRDANAYLDMEKPRTPGLTAADALLAVVEATGNKYHPDMTLEDVCNFVSMVCNSVVKTRGEGGVCYKNNPDGGEVWSLMVVPPVIEGDDLPKPETKYGRCGHCGNGASGEACSVCGRPGEGS